MCIRKTWHMSLEQILCSWNLSTFKLCEPPINVKTAFLLPLSHSPSYMNDLAIQNIDITYQKHSYDINCVIATMLQSSYVVYVVSGISDVCEAYSTLPSAYTSKCRKQIYIPRMRIFWANGRALTAKEYHRTGIGEWIADALSGAIR